MQRVSRLIAAENLEYYLIIPHVTNLLAEYGKFLCLYMSHIWNFSVTMGKGFSNRVITSISSTYINLE